MKSLFASLALLALLAAGCTDSPNEVGRKLLLPQDTLRLATQSFTASSDTTFTFRTALNAGRLFVGLHDGLEAASILQFSSVPAFASPQVVDSATLILQRNYAYVDSTTPFGLTAFRAGTGWSSSTFTWDSLAAYQQVSAGSAVVQSVAGDTAIRIPIDTATIRAFAGQTSASIMLRSTPNVIGMNMILGFGNIIATSADLRPELRVYYHDTTDTTITYRLRATTGISVADGPLPPHAGSMLLQGGIVTRGLVRFDSLALPPNASITAATLALPADPSLSLLNGSSRDSLIVYMTRKTVYPFDSTGFGTVCGPRSGDTLFAGQKYFSGDVKNIVQYWLTHHFNDGIVIHAYGQYSTMDRIALYGAASPFFRPRLTITYTVLP